MPDPIVPSLSLIISDDKAGQSAVRMTSPQTCPQLSIGGMFFGRECTPETHNPANTKDKHMQVNQQYAIVDTPKINFAHIGHHYTLTDILSVPFFCR